MNSKSLFSLAVMLLLGSSVSWASGATSYKAKCAGCHGHSGEGKPAMKAPALKGTQLDENQLVEQITKGKSGSKAPHNKAIAGLSEAQAKAIAEYIKTLQ